MNRRFLLSLAASALFGLVAIFIFQKILQNKLREQGAARPNQIVYAVTRIPAGTTIAANQVRLESHNTALEGAVLNTQEVIGKIAQVDLDAGLPIRAKSVASEKENKLINPKAGYRAFTIRVDEASSVAGFATPGSIVDVIAALTPSSNSKPVARTIVQGLRVLANGQQTQARTENQGRIGNTVTLEVTLSQAGMLHLAQREGALSLVLRNPADDELQPSPPVMIGKFVEDVKDETRPTPTPNLPPAGPWDRTPTPTPSPSPSPSASPTQKMTLVRVINGDKPADVYVKQQ